MLSHDEIGDVLHDLRVHQIELEMQNEELNRAQAALEASHARYFDLYDRAPVGYFTISETGLILEVNLTGAQLLGAERSDLVNRPFTRFIIGEDQDIYYVHWKRGFETDVPQKCELRMVKNNGTTCWMHLEAGIALSDSGVRVSRVIVSDISVRKQIEHGLRCAQEALEIAHCELQQSLEREKLLSHTDHLTGLYNRRYFYELAVREFDAAIRYRRPLTVFMFDVDRFKRVNDTLGHAFGDKALVRVAQVAAMHIRGADLLARYGGDEFVLMLPETSARQAMPMAERIRASVASGSESPRITISTGIAELQSGLGDTQMDHVVQRADKAMYLAKADGGNGTRTILEDPEKI